MNIAILKTSKKERFKMATKKKTATTTGKKDVVKKDEAALPMSVEELEALSGKGFEDADKDAYAIPFLRILQSNSPQVNEDDAAYIVGAKPGMFFNTVTGALYGKEIEIIPVHYGRDFVEWRPNRGGFVRAHGSDPAILDKVKEIDDKNNSILDNGNIIQDSRNFFILIADRILDGPIILSLVSTGLRHSQKFMTLLGNLRIPNSKTNAQAPMFAGRWRIWTVQNENDDGKWYQIGNRAMTAVEFIGWCSKEQMAAGLEAHKLVRSDASRADYDSVMDGEQATNAGQASQRGGNVDDDDVPF
jgi:hypothetical protein